MTNQYSQASGKRLETCHRDLQAIFALVLEDTDHTIICGHRSQAEQDAAFNAGNSKVQWPNSKHNTLPSMAVDAAPYFKGVGIDWQDAIAFAYFAGQVRRVAREAKRLGIISHDLRWGGDWDGDGQNKDQTFNDLVHFELV